MIVAVVLSAGESSRMGRPKALLPIGGVRFIERIVLALRASKVGKIVVVLGHNASGIHQQIVDLGVTIVINRDYRQGQLSSLQAAIRDIEANDPKGEVEGILVHLVDHPYITGQLVDLLIDRWFSAKKPIVIPRHRGRRGHPVIFSRTLFPELLQAPLNEGAKAVVHAHREDTLEVDTEDEGITIDIDTPEEYQRHVKGN
jgi:molybdenum cofactor cytidylyltransferase